jgi:hypothetical protein
VDLCSANNILQLNVQADLLLEGEHIIRGRDDEIHFSSALFEITSEQ